MAGVLSALGILLTVGAFWGGLLDPVLSGIPDWAVLLALTMVPPAILSTCLSGILLGLRRIVTINVIEVGRAASVLGGTILFAAWLRLGLTGALSAYVGSTIAATLAMAVLVQRAGGVLRPRVDREAIGKLVPFGLRAYVGNLLSFFNYRLDVFIVNYFLGPAGVGVYSVSVALAETLWYLPNSVGFVIFPKAASTSVQRMNAITPRVFWATLLLTLLGAVVLALTGETVIRWVYSQAFAAAYLPLLLLLPGVVLLGSGKVLTNEIAGRGFPHYNSINAGLSLLVTIAMDVLLIPRYGVAGAALAASIAYGVVFVTAVGFYLSVRAKATQWAVANPEFVTSLPPAAVAQSGESA